MSELAIVIVNFNVRDLLRDCLRSLDRARTGLIVDVWVVDNASTDGSAEMVASEFSWVNLRTTQANLGYARANNLALREILTAAPTRGLPRYVMLLNPDTEVPSDALTGLMQYLDSDSDVGAVGPRLLLANGQLDLACRRSFPTPEVALYRMTGLSRVFPRSARFGRYNLAYLPVDAVAEVDSVVGACMVVRGEVLVKVGLLDEAFFMYGEDLDWALRIKQFGWKIVYNGRVVVYHYKRASSSQRSVESLIAFYRAMLIFFEKHYASQTTWSLRWLVVGGIYLRAGCALVINQIRARRLAPSQVAR
ncbi:MAG TPA: glycosyltransferase family 2 protein [Chloroflexota bacterium]|nr:glycosyltransferase family 2 protein [Chloroflexota bacterium]